MTETTDAVAVLLRRAIRQGVIKPGERLVQEEIAGRLGVSRVPLREALRGLAAVGIVRMDHGRGFRVTKLEVGEVSELYALRLRIEPFIADGIIARMSAPKLTDLSELDRRMRSTVDAEEWANVNYDFHLQMYQAAGMNHTLRIVRQLLDLVEPYSRMYVHELHNLDRVHGEHTSMVEAIERGDATRLREFIALHLEGARDGLVAAMSSETDLDPIRLLVGLNNS